MTEAVFTTYHGDELGRVQLADGECVITTPELTQLLMEVSVFGPDGSTILEPEDGADYIAALPGAFRGAGVTATLTVG